MNEEPRVVARDEVPESALECHLSADDLGKVFVVAPAPTLKRPMAGAPPTPVPAAAKPAPEVDDDDITAEHEILNLEGAEGADVEVITLEGETVESKDIKLDPEKKSRPEISMVLVFGLFAAAVFGVTVDMGWVIIMVVIIAENFGGTRSATGYSGAAR